MAKANSFFVRVYDPTGKISKKLAQIALREKRSMGQQVAVLIEREFDSRVPVVPVASTNQS